MFTIPIKEYIIYMYISTYDFIIFIYKRTTLFDEMKSFRRDISQPCVSLGKISLQRVKERMKERKIEIAKRKMNFRGTRELACF